MYDATLTNGDTRALWYSGLSRADQEALSGDGPLEEAELRVDVAIVGAGIAGLSVAYHLCRRGHSVAVLDKGLVGSGETGRSTAHLSTALDDRYSTLEHTHGKHGAQLAAASHRDAIADIERIVREEQIACGFERVPGYLGSVKSGSSGERELRQELEAAQRAGVRVTWLDEPSFPGHPGPVVRFAEQAQLDPLAYLAGLTRAIRAHGGKVFTQTRVLDIQTSPPLLLCERQTQVHARDVVVATNTPIHERFAMHTKQAAYRSYAVGLQLLEPLPAALFWDTGDPYHYVRLADRGQVLIVGGEDHKVGQSREPERAWAELERWARERFPQARACVSKWSGQIQEPFDGLAFIGRGPGEPHAFIATGDSGNGMTHGAIAGLLLPALIAQGHHAWEHLYDPARKPHNRAVGQFARENANVAVHFAQLLAPQHRPSASDEGRVEQRGVRRVAVYVDHQGVSHERSAICPHLGCVVQWNRAERSWDCPCHGSRFDPYGRVLTGPSRSDLAALPAERTTTMAHTLKHDLSSELWQTETSASRHCRREAKRLGETPPARALLAAAAHADNVLAELPRLELGRPVKRGIGAAVGHLFSDVRDSLVDRTLTSERSYRGTLLGLRHGVDLVNLLLETARRDNHEQQVGFFERWLYRRVPLVDAVEAELRWFAERPDQALATAKGLFSASSQRLRARRAP